MARLFKGLMFNRLIFCAVALVITACSQPDTSEVATFDPPAPPSPHYASDEYPADLAEWGQLAVGPGALVLGTDVLAYDLNTALFTDYALKLRTVWIPEGAGPARYHDRQAFEFPVGTVITKTFYYPRTGNDFDHVSRDGASMDHFDGQVLDLNAVRLMETRVLVHRETGWQALPYVWNEAQTEARLARAGAIAELTLTGSGHPDTPFDYFVPNVNQCANCHETDTTDGLGVRPIGPKARHLNSDFAYFEATANQLDHWHQTGRLDGLPDRQDRPAAYSVSNTSQVELADLDSAARAYIDINCAHCHSRTGQADTSGLYLEPWEPVSANYGICKPPIAAGRGTGGRQYGIVPGQSEASIFVHRMGSIEPDVMMPELGRSTPHEEGVALVARWIDQMASGCS